MLAFPLIFTFIFGFFFGGGGAMNTGTVALVNNSKTQIAENFASALNSSSNFKIKTVANDAAGRDLIKKNQAGAIIEIPNGFGDQIPSASKQITVVIDPANVQLGATAEGFVGQYLTQINFAAAHIAPTFSTNIEKTTDKPLNYFDFVLMGIIGIALMNSSIIGVATAMVNYREDQILKRITTTPLATWKFIVAEILSRLVINVVQIGLIISIGKYFFGAHIYGSVVLLVIISLVGAVLFQSIGFTIASLAKTTEAADSMSTAVTVPMMFLTGVFFPIDSLPKWLYAVVQFLPLAPLLHIIRTIGSGVGSVFDDPKNLILVFAWIVICISVSIWKFRLAEE
ncbi:MAG: ABC transporter permease [Candidatus Berkelbacteria bacterium]|nr:ABC transporter permease [Candidatus Berkelbacteria bacterium]